jgi:hypothetical protein
MSANRLADLAHYLIWRCDPAQLGAVKLNKILWFADLAHYRTTGKTITGATAYTKLPHGPVPKGIRGALNALRHENKIAQATQNYYGFPKTMFLAVERPDLSAFSADEMMMIDAVADVICREHTAASISRLSHDALWDETEIGENITIGAGSIVPGDPTVEDLQWAEQALAD